MKKIYTKKFIVIAFVIIGFCSIYSQYGPAYYYSASVSGAPFIGGGQFCSNCHSGGSYGTTVSLQLLSGVTPVTQYNPGSSYTLRVTVNSTSLPATPRYGCQVICTQNNAPTYTNINTWGTLPAFMHNQLLSGRNHVEHSSPQVSNVFNIPWNAPATNVGTINFYAAGNLVNFNGNSSGDHPNKNSLTVTVNPLPITWLYFKGREDKGNVVLDWATSSQIDNGFFTIERSTDGSEFQELSKLADQPGSAETKTYSYTDLHPIPNAYYRIGHTDVMGEKNYYKTVQVKYAGSTTAFHYLQGNNIVLNITTSYDADAIADIYSLDGRKINSVPAKLKDGTNIFYLQKPSLPGIYFLKVHYSGQQLYASKLLITE